MNTPYCHCVQTGLEAVIKTGESFHLGRRSSRSIMRTMVACVLAAAAGCGVEELDGPQDYDAEEGPDPAEPRVAGINDSWTPIAGEALAELHEARDAAVELGPPADDDDGGLVDETVLKITPRVTNDHEPGDRNHLADLEVLSIRAAGCNSDNQPLVEVTAANHGSVYAATFIDVFDGLPSAPSVGDPPSTNWLYRGFAAGQIRHETFAIDAPAGGRWIDAVVDIDDFVDESNEYNNVESEPVQLADCSRRRVTIHSQASLTDCDCYDPNEHGIVPVEAFCDVSEAEPSAPLVSTKQCVDEVGLRVEGGCLLRADGTVEVSAWVVFYADAVHGSCGGTRVVGRQNISQNVAPGLPESLESAFVLDEWDTCLFARDCRNVADVEEVFFANQAL